MFCGIVIAVKAIQLSKQDSVKLVILGGIYIVVKL
jgi:hypothetical protein